MGDNLGAGEENAKQEQNTRPIHNALNREPSAGSRMALGAWMVNLYYLGVDTGIGNFTRCIPQVIDTMNNWEQSAGERDVACIRFYLIKHVIVFATRQRSSEFTKQVVTVIMTMVVIMTMPTRAATAVTKHVNLLNQQHMEYFS